MPYLEIEDITEKHWLRSVSPSNMITYLAEQVGSRKARLFAVACCYNVAKLMNKRSRNAVVIAERFADGAASRAELRAAIRGLHSEGRIRTVADLISEAIRSACELEEPSDAAIHAAWAARNAEYRSLHPRDTRFFGHNRLQCRFIEDIFGNPFRPAVVLDPDWLTWNDRIVPKLAQSIYDDRRYNLMPILADALEEAGCANADILDHCRGPGPHVRGCWVVDLVLGKS